MQTGWDRIFVSPNGCRATGWWCHREYFNMKSQVCKKAMSGGDTMASTIDCESTFDVLTRGPFPSGSELDAKVEAHLGTCHDCRVLAESLRPAVNLFHECLESEDRVMLPRFESTSCEKNRFDVMEAIRVSTRDCVRQPYTSSGAPKNVDSAKATDSAMVDSTADFVSFDCDVYARQWWRHRCRFGRCTCAKACARCRVARVADVAERVSPTNKSRRPPRIWQPMLYGMSCECIAKCRCGPVHESIVCIVQCLSFTESDEARLLWRLPRWR